MSVKRFDNQELKLDATRVVRLDNGMIRVPATLTRTGVFAYVKPDGSIVRELRLPEEVFAPESIATFQGATLTDDHPYKYKGHVSPQNFKDVSVGTVINVHQNGMNLDAELIISEEKAIDKVLTGKARQISNGYYCDREVAPPGSKYEGVPYDVIQRGIRSNHTAIVFMGRAGPEARIHLDSEDAILESPEIDTEACEPEATKKMSTLTLDGVDHEVPELVLASFTKNTTELETTRARLDAADKEITRLNADLKSANDTARIEALVKSRVALESQVRAVAPELKLDGLSELEIKKAVVLHLDSTASLEGKSAEAVDAYFDAHLKYASKRNPATEAAAKVIEQSQLKLDSAEEVVLSPREAFEANWKKTFVR